MTIQVTQSYNKVQPSLHSSLLLQLSLFSLSVAVQFCNQPKFLHLHHPSLYQVKITPKSPVIAIKGTQAQAKPDLQSRHKMQKIQSISCLNVLNLLPLFRCTLHYSLMTALSLLSRWRRWFKAKYSHCRIL